MIHSYIININTSSHIYYIFYNDELNEIYNDDRLYNSFLNNFLNLSPNIQDSILHILYN